MTASARCSPAHRSGRRRTRRSRRGTGRRPCSLCRPHGLPRAAAALPMRGPLLQSARHYCAFILMVRRTTSSFAFACSNLTTKHLVHVQQSPGSFQHTPERGGDRKQRPLRTTSELWRAAERRQHQAPKPALIQSCGDLGRAFCGRTRIRRRYRSPRAAQKPPASRRCAAASRRDPTPRAGRDRQPRRQAL